MSNLPDVSRRQFVVLAATCAAACACGGSALAADATTMPSATVDIGTVADYPQDGIFDKFIASHRIVVYRESGQIYVSTALCPHRGAVMKLKDGNVYCPKHGSTFSPAGTVIKGPAKNSLERYAISTDANGHLLVDTSTAFREKKWEDPASFVKVG